MSAPGEREHRGVSRRAPGAQAPDRLAALGPVSGEHPR
jgi:hypothetical protein